MAALGGGWVEIGAEGGVAALVLPVEMSIIVGQSGGDGL